MRLRSIILLLAIVLSLPLAFANHLNQPELQHSTYDRVDNPPEPPSKNITMGKAYLMEERPENTLPSEFQDTENYGRATRNPYYTTFSYTYYKQGARIIPRDVFYGRTPEDTPPLTGGYWGVAPKAMQRVYDRRDYSEYYDPRSGYDELKYWQRRITKTEEQLNETMIMGRDLYQRKLESDPRVKSLGLPAYVDVTQVDWYVPPENPKRRVYRFAEARPQRQDEKGKYRFLPGVFQPRTYYDYGERHIYVNRSDRAQRYAEEPMIEAQRVIGIDSFSRAQRTLSDEYGEKYGYEIERPPLSFLYSIEMPEESTGSVYNAELFKYIRNKGKLPSDEATYDKDPRFAAEIPAHQRNLGEQYAEYFYKEPRVEEVLAEQTAHGQRVLDTSNLDAKFRKEIYDTYYVDGENTREMPPYAYEGREFFTARIPEYHSEYYKQKLAFINARYAFIHRAAAGSPKIYEARPDAYKYEAGYQPVKAQRILQYETESALPSAQRAIGSPSGTAQRRLTNVSSSSSHQTVAVTEQT